MSCRITLNVKWTIILPLAAICLSPVASAQQGVVEAGLTYLRGAQEADGSWTGGPPANRAAPVVTGTVMEAFIDLGLSDEAGLIAAADYLAGISPTGTADRAWQVIGLAQAGRSTLAARSALTDLQRSDGTWGESGPGSPTTTCETAVALRAYRVAGSAANQELSALRILLRRQRPNGGFDADGSAASDVEATGQVLELLHTVSSVYIVDPFIESILAYLRASQNPDGGWGAGTSNTFDTAYALFLLISSGSLPDDPAGAINFLLDSQEADGSWAELAEDTAYAVRSLQDVRADLTVVPGSIVFSNETPSTGDVVSVTGEVRNIGLVASGAFQARFYDGHPNFGGTSIGDPIDLAGLDPGESFLVSVDWNTASSGGNRQIFCVADVGGVIEELDETNNSASASIFVLAETDLVITAADITFNPPNPVLGDSISMRVRVRNEGREARDVVLRIFEGTFMIAEGVVPIIPEGQQVIFTIPLPGLQVGRHEYRIEVDPENQIMEGNEENNIATNAVFVSARRDIYITSDDIAFVPGRPLVGDEVTVSAVIHNQGDEGAENVVVQFFRGNPETGGVQLGNSRVVEWIPANGNTSAQVRFDTTGMAGTFEIFVLVDATDNVAESDETNNVASKTISVAQNIDLTVLPDLIRFSNDLPEDGEVITITATVKNAGIVGVPNVTVQFYDGPPSTTVPSWPVETGGSVLSSPIFADVDGDRRLEILVGSLDSYLYLLRSDGRDYSGWPIELGGGVRGSPAVGDVDGDIQLEVVVGAVDGSINAFNLDGSEVTGFPFFAGDEIVSSPCLADIDMDGVPEIAIGSRDGFLYVLNGDGTPVPGFPVTTDSWIDSSPAIGDIDADGFPEVVVGSHDEKLHAWNHDGIPVLGFPIQTDGFISASPALGDIDRDGVLEVVVGSDDGKVYAHNGDGSRVDGWPKETGSFVRSSPAIVDVDGNGTLDVVAASFDQRVYAWDGDGVILPGFPRLLGTEIESSPVVADIDADGLVEIVVGGRDGLLYAVNSDGTLVGGAFPFETTDDVRSSPLLADIDADGAMEAVVGSDDGRIYAFDLEPGSFNPLNIQWPMFGRDARHQRTAGPFTEPAGSAGRPIGGPRAIGSLSGGESKEASVDWDTTGGLGGHTIFVQVDPDNEIVETDETNNLGSREIYVLIPDTADFIVQSRDIAFSPPQIEPGDTLHITVDVRNVGTRPADAVLVRVLDGSPAAPDSQILTETRQDFPAGGTVRIACDWVTDATDEGGHTIFVLVDPENEVEEFNEFDNATSRFFYVGNRPPWLNWVNFTTTNEFSTAPYAYSGVEPELGFVDTEFVFQIAYSDPDDNPPGEGYPRVYIDINGDGDTVDEFPEFREGSFAMVETNPADQTYTDGKVYEFQTHLPLGNLIRYRFEAVDTSGDLADGEPRVLYQNLGPAVVKQSIRVNSMPDYVTWIGRKDPGRLENMVTLYGNVHFVGGAEAGYWIWEFGDGSSPEVGLVEDADYIAVDHVYGNIGSYEASLTVIDEFGNSDTDFVKIEVLLDSKRVRRRALVLDALRFLYTRQNKTWGYFEGPSSNRPSTTALSLLAFTDHDFLQIDDFDDSIFAEYIAKGYRYLYTRATQFRGINFDPNSKGHPGTFPIFDRNGNDMSYYWRQTSAYYETGMVLMGFTGDRESRLYIEFVQDVVDFFLAAQSVTGGWRYSFRADIDNSACQWPVLGLHGASQCPFFADIPDWVWAANHPDDPYGTGLLSWIDASQNTTPGNSQGAFGYTGPTPKYTVTPAGIIMCFAAGVPLTGIESKYIFNVSDLLEGEYYIYARISDGVNDPYYTYMPESFTVVNHAPTITVKDPDARSGGTPADEVFYITWLDWDLDDDARVSLFYDDDTDPDNGFLGTIAEDLSEDSPDDYYRWNTGAVPQGQYRVYARIEDAQGQIADDYSDGLVIVEHDTRPVVQALEPREQNIVDGGPFVIQWIAHDLHSATGVVSVWYDTNNSGHNGTAIVEDIPLERGTVGVFIWDTSDVPEAEYWIYVSVSDGENITVSDYAGGTIWVNHPPVIDFTTPNGLGESPNSGRTYRINWAGGDQGGANLDLYWDSDGSGQDGTVIASDLNINSRYYNWNVASLPEGVYHVYGVADDGVNAPVVEYASGTVQVPAYGPTITVHDPAASTTVDSVYWTTWSDEAPNSDASIQIWLDPDTNRTNGNEIVLLAGISEDDETDAAQLDVSSVTPGTYYVAAAINETATPEDAVVDYSPQRLTVAHDGSPHVFMIDPGRDVVDLTTGADYSASIRFVASDTNSDATVELYHDGNNYGYDGTAIVSATEALSENQDNVSTYVWDTSEISSRDYYIYAYVYGATQTERRYAPGRIRVNQPPTIELTAPLGTEASEEATFRITWTDFDDGDDARISLYYDVNDSGEDGELILSGRGENWDGTGDQYDWDLSRVPAGDYYVYAIIDDGVNAPVIDYSTGTVTVQLHIPRATVLEPNSTSGDVLVDHRYTVLWDDWDIDSNATVDFYLDTNRTAGGEIVLATGEVFEDDPQDYYTVDVSGIPEGDYYVQLRLSDDNRATEYRYYSVRRLFIRHAGSPAVLADDSAFADLVTESTVELRWMGEDLDSNATVNLYWANSETFATNRPILTDLPESGPTPASQVISVTTWSSNVYYLIATIDDGVNPTVYNISNHSFRVNRAPTLTFTSPVDPDTPPDNPTGNRDLFTIRWMAYDSDDTAMIDLYYDTDNVGFDGTLIVENLREGSHTNHAWDTRDIPGGSYYIYAVLTDPYHDPVRVYSPGAFRVDGDHKPQLTLLSPFSGEDTWDQFFVLQWEDYDADSNATVSFYIENATPGFDGAEEPIVEGISEDNEDDFYIWDISSATEANVEILGVISDATWTVEAKAPRPLKIQHPETPDLKPALVFVDPGNDLLPSTILVGGQRVRGEITSSTETFTLRFVAFDLETPQTTTIDIYRDNDNSGFNGTLITADAPITNNKGTNSFEWDISATEGGTYYFYAVIFDGVNDPVSFYSHSVLHINREPRIELIPPDPPFDVVDEELVIDWTALDPDTVAEISLFLDTDDEGFDGILIVSGLNEDVGGGPAAGFQWLENRYEANLFPGHPLVNNTEPWFHDSYYTYGVAKALRLYEILEFGGGDWDADLVDFFAEDDMHLPDGSFDMTYGSGGSFLNGSGEDFYTMHTAFGVLSLTEAVLGTKPVADAGEDRRVAPGERIVFDGSESFHPNKRRKIILYEWDFDDDGVIDYASEEPTAEHTFMELGVYPVTLRVSDDDFCESLTDDDIAIVTVTDGNRPPVAEFTASPDPGLVGFQVTFDGSGSSDPDGDGIAKYEWDLTGNGLFNDGTGPVVTWVYDRVQTVNVGLRVTDDDMEEPLSGFTRNDLDIVEADLAIIAQGDAPDPFSPGSSPGRKDTNVISFDISKRAHPMIKLWNSSDTEVRTLGPETKQRGGNTYSWNGRSDANQILPSDLYTYKIGDEGAVLYPELGLRREDGVRLTDAADPDIRRREDFSLQMLYTSEATGEITVRAASSMDGLVWTDEGIVIPQGLSGEGDGAAAREPDFVKLSPTVQDSWSAGVGIDYASGVSVEPVAGGIQLGGSSRNLALDAEIREASSTPPENYYGGAKSLTQLVDGVLPSETNARDSGWVAYRNRTATMTIELSEVLLVERLRVYLKTDTGASPRVYYPDELVVLSTTDVNVAFATQEVVDLRGLEEEDNARWVEVEFPGGLAAQLVAVRLRSLPDNWMEVGEIELIQDGFDASGYLISNVFDLGAEGLLSVEWDGTRPANTSLVVQVRSGDTPESGASWSGFAPVGQNEILEPAPRARYVQYRADLRTGIDGNYNVTPILEGVRFNDLRRIYYTGNDGSTDRILSALSLDGITYVPEAGVRLEPGGPLDADGVMDPSYTSGIAGFGFTDLASIRESMNDLILDASGLSLDFSAAGTNFAAASGGTTVLTDFDRFSADYPAEKGIEGDGGANRASRWAGSDPAGPPWTIDFDLGQERSLRAVRMLRHDGSYEVTGFEVYGGTVYTSTDENNFESFTLMYDSPVYPVGTDHKGRYKPFTARYIRLAINNWANGHPEFAEFELYGDVAFATEGVFLSRGFRAGDQGITAITWDADIPAGTDLRVEVRTGPGLLINDRWSDFIEVEAGVSLFEAGLSGEFAQLRITLISDGTDTPVFRSISINGKQRLYYTGVTGGTSRILSAISADGLVWERDSAPVIDVGGLSGFDNVAAPDVLELPDGSLLMHFLGQQGAEWAVYRATSLSGAAWDIDPEPVLVMMSGESGLGSTQFLPLLDGTSRLYFTSLVDGAPRILSAAAAPEGQIEVDNIPPDVAISFPIPDSVLTGTINVSGTATDRNYLGTTANFVRYLFELSGDGGQSWQSLTSVISPVVDDVLYVLDTQAFADGIYLLRLSAEDRAANESDTTVRVRFENGPPPRPIITGPTVHGVPVTVAGSPITVQGFSANNTNVEGFLTTADGTRRSIGTVETTGGNAIPQIYSDDDYSGGPDVAYDSSSTAIEVDENGDVSIALDMSSSNRLSLIASATASSVWNTSYPARNANDGNTNSYWASGQGLKSAWLALEWDEPVVLARCRIRWRDNYGGCSDFALQAMIGGSYQEILTSTETKGTVDFDLGGLETTGLRLLTNSITRPDIEIFEFEAYAMHFTTPNVAAEANGGRLVSFTSQYDGGYWAAPNVIRGIGNYWASANLGGATDQPQEFVIELATDGGDTVPISRMVVYNYGQNLNRYCRDFEVAVSATNASPESFTRIFPDTLEPREGPQIFEFPRTDARYLKFSVLSANQPDIWDLDEIQVFRDGGQGVLVSTVKGSGAIDDFNLFEYFAVEPANTSVRAEIRTGNVVPPDENLYTPWIPTDNGAILDDDFNARYIQYRVFLETLDHTVTPVLEEVRISTVGEYGNWAIPNVGIEGGTNTITAVAIDRSDLSRSEEALPIEVRLDLVQVEVTRDRDTYSPMEDVNIDLDVTSPDTTPAPGVQERTFVAHLRILDAIGRTMNADELGMPNHDILMRPFWVDDALPTDATYSENFTWTSVFAYRSAQSHTSESATGEVEHAFQDTTDPLAILRDSRIVQFVHLDPDTPPREIMLEFTTGDGNSDHRIFWGEDLINRGTLGTPSRFAAGLLPPAGEWARLEVDPADVGIQDATLTGIAFITVDGFAYWDRTALGVREFDLTIGVAENKHFEFAWDTDAYPDGDYYVDAFLSFGELERAAQDVSEVFAILPDLNVVAEISTDRPHYQQDENVRLSYSSESLSINHMYHDLTLAVSVPRIDGSTVPLFETSVPVMQLSPRQLLQYSDRFNVGDALAGTYQANLEVLEGSPPAVIATANTSFDVLVDESAIIGTITVSPPIFQPGTRLDLIYVIRNTANGTVDLPFQIRILYQDLGSDIEVIDIGRHTLARGDVVSGTAVLDTAGYLLGDYVAFLEADGGAWVLDSDEAQALLLATHTPTIPASLTPTATFTETPTQTATPTLTPTPTLTFTITPTVEVELYQVSGMGHVFQYGGDLVKDAALVSDVVRDIDLPSLFRQRQIGQREFYVLLGGGAVWRLSGTPGGAVLAIDELNGDFLETDFARDLELVSDDGGRVILDGSGLLYLLPDPDTLSDGGYFTYQGSPFFFEIVTSGGLAIIVPQDQAVDLEVTEDGQSYMILKNDGTVFFYGDTFPFSVRENAPIPAGHKAVDLEIKPDCGGYWVMDDLGFVYRMEPDPADPIDTGVGGAVDFEFSLAGDESFYVMDFLGEVRRWPVNAPDLSDAFDAGLWEYPWRAIEGRPLPCRTPVPSESSSPFREPTRKPRPETELEREQRPIEPESPRLTPRPEIQSYAPSRGATGPMPTAL